MRNVRKAGAMFVRALFVLGVCAAAHLTAGALVPLPAARPLPSGQAAMPQGTIAAARRQQLASLAPEVNCTAPGAQAILQHSAAPGAAVQRAHARHSTAAGVAGGPARVPQCQALPSAGPDAAGSAASLRLLLPVDASTRQAGLASLWRHSI
ncbi:MAG TPA: hypothetical protein VF315_06605 [Steroidobacteraceae bacterium]